MIKEMLKITGAERPFDSVTAYDNTAMFYYSNEQQLAEGISVAIGYFGKTYQKRIVIKEKGSIISKTILVFQPNKK